ncbi:MAG: competence protein TfoX [Calditrichaeota bacterium]|nr:MAG: competence protein TfoX [Calditrichota bacterium]
MRNIGHKSLSLLHKVGIYNLEDLRRVGGLETYLKLKKIDSSVTKNMLWALLGAELNMDWRELPIELKNDLLMKLENENI